MKKKLLNSHKAQSGFTLVEVLLVVVILAVISTIAIQKISGSSDKARMNADIATARQVQAALDRYEVENGVYPKSTELEVNATTGEVEGNSCDFVPEYISKLDSTVTQQREGDTGPKKGFGVTALSSQGSEGSVSNIIMIYLTDDGSKAEVRAYSSKNGLEIWPTKAVEEQDTDPPGGVT